MARKNSLHAYELGRKGEKAVYEILQERGYRVEWPSGFDEDLLIDSFLTVEVKTAKLSGRTDSKYQRWQFCLFPHPGRDKPFCEDVLILRCESSPPVHFIIPGYLVSEGLTKIDITTKDPHKYRGKWSIFKEAWETIYMLDAYILLRGRPWRKK